MKEYKLLASEKDAIDAAKIMLLNSTVMCECYRYQI
jgi:hypothetical protein